MSFRKAADLVKLARMASARRQGVTYAEVADEFGMSERNAKRMVAALQDLFDVERSVDAEQRARFHIRDLRAFALATKPDTALEALELAIRQSEPDSIHREALKDLRTGVLGQLDKRTARRAEADAETLMQMYGHVARPGPRTRKNPAVMRTLGHALRGPFLLSMRYGSDSSPRIVAPFGLLQGVRDYLVARQPDRQDTVLRKFRIDLIHEASCLDETFELPEDFSIEDHAAEGFGVWNDPDEMAEVVWRFLPEAARRAAEFRFHPRQSAEYAEDGSLIVRFTASGWNEMAWYLYQWGDKVEVLAPEGLRRKVEGHQRSDFPMP